MRTRWIGIGGLFGLFLSQQGLAAGGGVKIINYYEIILSKFMGDHAVHEWMPVLGALLSLAVLFILGNWYSSKVSKQLAEDPAPSSSYDITTFVESILDFVMNLGRDVIGAAQAPRFFTLLASLFLFIFISNLSGLVPGFPPATESVSTNWGIAAIVFVAYNAAGFREHGIGYLKQLVGPVIWLAWLIIPIELVSHFARPLSLGLRLYGNIFGDHLVLSVFTGLTYVVFPAFLLFFGLLVATIQSFVFTLLSSIYISLAISHDH